MSKTLGILFGLNYIGTDYQLDGCINDVILMKNCMNKYMEIPLNNITTLTDKTPLKPTKKNMIKIIEQNIQKLNTTKYNRLWIHYSGHGYHMTDTSGDEVDKKDEVLCPLVLNPSEDEEFISDDELNTIFSKIYSNKTLICVFDCCHSGTLLDMPYHYNYKIN